MAIPEDRPEVAALVQEISIPVVLVAKVERIRPRQPAPWGALHWLAGARRSESACQQAGPSEQPQICQPASFQLPSSRAF